MDLFQQFLNRAQRQYGQLDKKVFGGLLPGGAATPIGAAFQNIKGPQPNPNQRRTAAVLDATAGVIAGVQPMVEKIVKNAPASTRSVVSSGLNKLPFSANLFGRYFTGLNAEGLEIPETITKDIEGTLKRFNRPKAIKEAKTSADNFENMLNAIKAGTYKSPMGTQIVNDTVAQLKSDVTRMEKGDIPYFSYMGTSNKNPLTSPATSVGSAWFSQVPGGYQAQETYDFVYGGADKYAGPFKGIPELTPSQSMALTAVSRNPLFNTAPGVSAAESPITNFGRAVVSKIKPKSFDYVINVR